MPLRKKTLNIRMDVETHIAEDYGPGNSVFAGKAEPIGTFKIEVDGEEVLEIPNIRNYTIANAPLYPEVEKRLKLLEDILESADTYGMAVVIRERGDYTVDDVTRWRRG